MSITLHNGDCMEALRAMPDNAFELAIVDPPYGIGESGGKDSRNRFNCTSYENKEWDTSAPNALYFDELRRVSRNQIIWGANHFIDSLPFNCSSPCWVVWDKETGGSDFADCELAWTSFKTAVRMFKFRWSGMLQGDMKNKEARIHPTQKPVALYKWLLANYAKEGDRILDTHLGSGSIAIACHDARFDLVGYELDKDYYEAACARLKKHQAQGQFEL